MGVDGRGIVSTRQQRSARERAAREGATKSRQADGLRRCRRGASGGRLGVRGNDHGQYGRGYSVPGDTFCSLREAIQNANNNAATNGNRVAWFRRPDTIVFSLGRIPARSRCRDGTELPQITDHLTINGPGAGALTISGNNASRIFNIGTTPPIDVTINNLTLTAGRLTAGSGGAIYAYATNLTLVNVVISGNTATKPRRRHLL